MRAKRFKAESLANTHHWVLRKMVTLFPMITTAEDALTSIGIVVTEEDIAAAKPGNPTQCAVAIACSKLPGLLGGFIGRTMSWLVYSDGRAVRYKTPVATYAKVMAFDMAGRAEPGIYTLSRVAPALRMGEMSRRKHISDTIQAKKNKGGRPKAQKHQPVSFATSHFRTWNAATAS